MILQVFPIRTTSHFIILIHYSMYDPAIYLINEEYQNIKKMFWATCILIVKIIYFIIFHRDTHYL